QVGEVDVGLVRVGFGREEVDVPAERRFGGRGLGQAHDVSVHVALLLLAALHVAVGARVGGVHGGLGACAVVGQCDVDLAVLRVHAGPLGAVHLGGARRVGG